MAGAHGVEAERMARSRMAANLIFSLQRTHGLACGLARLRSGGGGVGPAGAA
jgi:hypothetical protein